MNTNQVINQDSTTNIMFQSKTIVCIECGNNFDFSVDEQKFFHNHGFINQPKRCPNCRVVRRLVRKGQEASLASKVNCAECSRETTVPFLPMQGKPVYCSSCFVKFGGGKKKRSFVS